MNNEQIRNVLIGLAVVVLLVLGVFYYQKQEPNPIPQETDTENIEENTDSTTTVSPTEEEILQKKKVDQANSAELKAQEVAKTEKWNILMTKARSAFNRGAYEESIDLYNEALSIYKNDAGYAGLFYVYNAQNDIERARVAIDAAIKLNPKFTEHWKNELSLLDDKTNVSYLDLKRIYGDGLQKVDPVTKIDLVTFFARIAENNKEYNEAIALWGYAKQLYPQDSSIYQAEIDRLQKING